MAAFVRISRFSLHSRHFSFFHSRSRFVMFYLQENWYSKHFLSKTVQVGGNKSVNFLICDTIGLDRID